MVKAELLCLKPSTTGLVYPRFDPEKHVITPAQAYKRMMGADAPDPRMTKRELIALAKERDLPFYGGMDFGYSHLFAYVHGFRDISRFFIVNAIAMPELEKDQQLEVMEPFRVDKPAIYADTEDPGGVQIFRNKGFKMPKWKKFAGSVPGGIACVQMKLCPSLGADPELFFVREIGEDPGMDLLVKYTREHHWKLDAANEPTDLISDDNKDLPDALRYCIMNVFPFKSRFGVSSFSDNQPTATVPADENGIQYGLNTWMSQEIARLTGGEFRPKEEKRQIKISSLEGKKLVFDIYADNQQPVPESDSKGRSGGFLWDLS
jgi:hypothetical protein